MFLDVEKPVMSRFSGVSGPNIAARKRVAYEPAPSSLLGEGEARSKSAKLDPDLLGMNLSEYIDRDGDGDWLALIRRLIRDSSDTFTDDGDGIII